MRRSWRSFDFILFIAVCVLVFFGIIMIGSAIRKDMTNENIKQIVWFGMGIVLMLFAAFIDYHFICRFYIIIYIACCAILIAVLAYGYLKGLSVKRWFEIGTTKLQPSEFAKIFMIIFLATFIDKHKDNMNSPAVLLFLCAAIGVPVLLVMMQPSLTAGLVLLVVSLAILFVGELSAKIVLSAIVTVVPASVLLYLDLINPNHVIVDKIMGYQLERVQTFLNPAEDSDAFFQTGRSIKAIGSGQFSGKGLFNGPITQFKNLPEAHNDFIFSVIGEELGFVGCIAALTLLLFIIVKCLFIAKNSSDFLGKLIATGVAVMFAFQAFVNVGVSTGLLPNTGMPFPFISYGGSAMWINMVAIGLVINVGMTKTKSIFEG